MMRSRIQRHFRKKKPDLTVLLFALFAAAAANAADGVPERCLKCHTEAKIIEKVLKTPAPERARKLEAFLPNHFAPDAAERAAIIATLNAKTQSR